MILYILYFKIEYRPNFFKILVLSMKQAKIKLLFIDLILNLEWSEAHHVLESFSFFRILSILFDIPPPQKKNKTKSLKSCEKGELKLKRWMVIKVNRWINLIDE